MNHCYSTAIVLLNWEMPLFGFGHYSSAGKPEQRQGRGGSKKLRAIMAVVRVKFLPRRICRLRPRLCMLLNVV